MNTTIILLRILCYYTYLCRSGSDIDKNNDYIRNQKSINKPIFDISLKRFEKNKQIKHLSEIIIDDENRDNKKTNKTANSNSGVKMKMTSGGN